MKTLNEIPDEVYIESIIAWGDRLAAKLARKKVWDITPPQDDWERGYAKLEYLRNKMNNITARKIEVKNAQDV